MLNLPESVRLWQRSSPYGRQTVREVSVNFSHIIIISLVHSHWSRNVEAWLSCTERIYYMRPYAIKNHIPQKYPRHRGGPRWSPLRGAIGLQCDKSSSSLSSLYFYNVTSHHHHYNHCIFTTKQRLTVTAPSAGVLTGISPVSPLSPDCHWRHLYLHLPIRAQCHHWLLSGTWKIHLSPTTLQSGLSGHLGVEILHFLHDRLY